MEVFKAQCQDIPEDVVTVYKAREYIEIDINYEVVVISTADAKRLADFIYKHIGE